MGAQINWQAVGDGNRVRGDDIRQNINTAMIVALFFEDQKLSVYRMFRPGHWQSSGVICWNLPERVLPCVFMSSFCGLAEVAFAQLWASRPYICPCCDNRGFFEDWQPINPSRPWP